MFSKNNRIFMIWLYYLLNKFIFKVGKRISPIFKKNISTSRYWINKCSESFIYVLLSDWILRFLHNSRKNQQYKTPAPSLKLICFILLWCVDSVECVLHLYWSTRLTMELIIYMPWLRLGSVLFIIFILHIPLSSHLDNGI